MDLRTIAQRIQNREYSNLDELEKDLQLMVKNARTFNEPGSMIYKVVNTEIIGKLHSYFQICRMF